MFFLVELILDGLTTLLIELFALVIRPRVTVFLIVVLALIVFMAASESDTTGYTLPVSSGLDSGASPIQP